MSHKISGNFKFSYGMTKPKYSHIFPAPGAIGRIGFRCNVLPSPASGVYGSCPYVRTIDNVFTVYRVDCETDKYMSSQLNLDMGEGNKV